MRKLRLEELNRPGIDEYREKIKFPFVVVLDNIRSALNVGSIFRSCDAFAIDHLYLCGITARPPHKEINKTAIGATASVDWTYKKDVETLVKTLKSQSYSIIGIEQTTGSVSLDRFDLPKANSRFALILGNEVDGLSEDLLPLLDHCIEVPQFGTKHSINVAVCAGLVLWDLLVKYRRGQNL